VSKCLSVISIVKAPAKTGIDSNSRNAVMKMDHANRGALKSFMDLICRKVDMKFMAPISEDKPAKCNAPIKKSTADPGL
jgi:hypothetical protein